MTSSCEFGGCGRPIRRHGLCDAHSQQRRAGKVLLPISQRRTPRRELPALLPSHVVGKVLVPLADGSYATIDEQDAHVVSRHLWSANRGCKSGIVYAQTTIQLTDGTPKTLTLHRLVGKAMGIPTNRMIDHESRDGLDCSRSNLRAAGYEQNAFNRRRRVTNLSGYKGVSKHGAGWRTQVYAYGRLMFSETFRDLELAAFVYAEAAAKFHGEFARAA